MDWLLAIAAGVGIGLLVGFGIDHWQYWAFAVPLTIAGALAISHLQQWRRER